MHLTISSARWQLFCPDLSVINSSPPSATYMRQWTGSALVQIMACCLIGAKPLSKPMLGYCQLDPYEQTSVKSNQNTKLFIHENAFENIVCRMTTILSRGDELMTQWVVWWACLKYCLSYISKERCFSIRSFEKRKYFTHTHTYSRTSL